MKGGAGPRFRMDLVALLAAAVIVAGSALLAAIAGDSRGDAGATGGPRRGANPLDAARVDERLGAMIPLELRFLDTEGRSRALAEFFDGARGGVWGGAPRDGRPVLLILAYYGCRTLCNLVLEGTARALAGSDTDVGVGYRVVTVSIDPRETPVEARHKVGELGSILGWGESSAYGAQGWSFLVGNESEIAALAGAVGFGYRYDPGTDQYSHPAVVIALTPGGAISSYIYGVNPDPGEVASALGVAAAGGTRSALERILMRCFHYVPALRRHAGLVGGILRGGGALTLVAIAVLFWRLVVRGTRGAVVR